ncbi:MAG TPA: 4-oxalocrotonate tautomerase DmpI [Bacteroidales bacterium]|nr:4-oxalocrotonate tautomerase DmpI [Bacteroidales bacterium]
MPVIQFEGPEMTKDQKARLVKAFAEQASQILHIPEDAFVTILRENDMDNIGNGSQLLSQKFSKQE